MPIEPVENRLKAALGDLIFNNILLTHEAQSLREQLAALQAKEQNTDITNAETKT